MTIFKVQTNLAATVYIRAATQDEALAKLGPLCGLTVDLRNLSWFSDAMLCDPSLPEISLATSMTLYPPESLDELEIASRSKLKQALAMPELGGIKSAYNRQITDNSVCRVFSVDLQMQGSVYVRARTKGEVIALLSPCRGVDINFIEDWIGPDCITRTKLPAALCPYLTLAGIWPGNDMELSGEFKDNPSAYEPKNAAETAAELKKLLATRTLTDSDIAALQMIRANVPYFKQCLQQTLGKSGEISDKELTDMAMLNAQRSAIMYLNS